MNENRFLAIQKMNDDNLNLRYWLVVTRPENLARLNALGLNFISFATEHIASRICIGDMIVLYRSGGDRENPPGIVGIFESTGGKYFDNRREMLNYRVRVPWRPLHLSLESPLAIKPLVPELKMFPNKDRWGGTLQRALISITKQDFEAIKLRLAAHIQACSPSEG